MESNSLEELGILHRKCNQYECLDSLEITNSFKGWVIGLLRIKAGFSECCRLLTHNSVFEMFILLIILANTVALALEDPNSEDSIFMSLDEFFLYVYTAEAVLKIGGMGLLFPRKSYLRDPWNVLDFAVVTTAWIEFMADKGVNLRALRALRVLRPLRSITSIKGLRILIIALFNSIKPLMFAVVVFLLYLSIFAVTALQLWMGQLRYRCIDVSSGLISDTLCGECAAGLECAYTLDNPNYGITSFDNFFAALLAMFQSVTLEGWSTIMQYTNQSIGQMAYIFFTPLVFIGAFLMVNFILAVIKYHFTTAIVIENDLGDDKELSNNPGVAKSDKTKVLALLNEIPESLELIEEDLEISDLDDNSNHDKRKNRGFFLLQSSFMKDIKTDKKIPDTTLASERKHKVSIENEDTYYKSIVFNKSKINLLSYSNEMRNGCKYYIQESELLKSSSEEDTKDLADKSATQWMINDESFDFRSAFASFQKQSQRNYLQVAFFAVMQSGFITVNNTNSQFASELTHSKLYPIEENKSSGKDVDVNFDEELEQQFSAMKYRLWSTKHFRIIEKSRFLIKIFVQSRGFSIGLIISVILNTLVLSMDHHGMDEDMEEVLDLMNSIFTVIFLIEMVLKITGLGIVGYLNEGMNYLDGSVVIVSIIEFTFFSDSSGLTAFRTIRIFKMFRVLRVARLFRYLNSMAAIMRVLGKSVSSFIYLALLLILFSVIFTLLGMGFFAGQFDFDEGTPRANFDNFQTAFMTVFQVLTMEEWPQVLYDGMRSVGDLSSLYFILWIFLGNFVFLNLFLAIVLDSFDQDEEIQRKDRSWIGSIVERKRKEKAEKNVKMLREIHEKGNEENDLETLRRIKTFVSKKQFFQDIECKKSYYIFPKHNCIRIYCYRISVSHKFDHLMLGIIILSSCKLIWDTYLVREDSNDLSEGLDYTFAALFFLEFLIKSISMGFVMDEGSYLREKWHQLDLVIILISVLELSIQSVNFQYVKVLRLLRTLRPLRFISHNLSMRMVVNALLESFCAIINVLIVLLIVWLIFAIIGVSLFSGTFYSCADDRFKDQDLCATYGYDWVNADFHFDSVPEAMLTLFVISTLEGWPSIMYNAVDAHGVGLGPSTNHSPAAAYYFVIFIFVVPFFFVNLFIGVVFMQFNNAKHDESSAYSLVLNERELKWIEIQSLITHTKPMIEKNHDRASSLRRKVYALVGHPVFNACIGVSILCNMIVFAAAYNGASETYNDVLHFLNIFFIFVYIIEAVLKISAYGKSYFKNNWNKFDFCVVAISLMDIVFLFSLSSLENQIRVAPQIARFIRILRVTRLLRNWEALSPLQDLIIVMGISLPAILNVLSLLILIFFIYAILGAFIYYDIESGRVVDSYYNFDGFGNAMVALLRISTGENWNLMMKDIGNETNTAISILYFCSFKVITSFVMLNLFVMVIVQSYQDYMKNPENSRQAFKNDIMKFKKVWAKFSDTRIKYTSLMKFMKSLGKVDSKLGFPPLSNRSIMIGILYSMDLFIDEEGFVYFHDLLYGVLKRRYFQRKKYRQNSLQNKIMKREADSTHEKLKDLRKKNWKSYTIVSIGNREQFFFDFVYTRSIFKAWKNMVKEKKAANNNQSSS